MPNWKAPGKDGFQAYWIKNLQNLHELIGVQRNETLIGDDSPLAWMTHGRTVLSQKNPRKGSVEESYRPDMHDYVEQEKLKKNREITEKQKGCGCGSRGTKFQLLINKTVLKDCKKRHTNLPVAWTDYKKAHDFFPYSWINECMELLGIAENVRNFWEKSMKELKLLLIFYGEVLWEVDIWEKYFSETVFHHCCLFRV